MSDLSRWNAPVLLQAENLWFHYTSDSGMDAPSKTSLDSGSAEAGGENWGRNTVQLDPGESKAVIQDFSLSLDAGEFIALVGPSGCGKSTLLKLLGGFLPPDRGRVLWRGEPLKGPGPNRVMVFQEFDQLFPWKRVRANVEFPLKHGGGGGDSSIRLRDKKARAERVRAMLQEVGLYEAHRHFPYQLSGGMKQRTALARALVCRPDMLLMDEPFGSLDAQKREELQGQLLRMWREHQFAALFVTHDISEALFLADRILVLPTAGGPGHTEIKVDLPRPRDRSSSEFRSYYSRIYSLL